MAKFEVPRLLSARELNTIRGKASVGHASTQELQQIFGHIDALESALDHWEMEDSFGTEGWRHTFNHPDAE